ncbi:hypothetical protein SAMN05421819_3548 [Bryocella elongata]|uniref:Uncharacterized protein n=1 Tax=Bryocella elongata TaxID=863522 RepID=A0A1H6B5M4_9BACT|nr:hypothetical protein [Bryocella elongata]SEG56151.1 hypothetical protein SAMN05421819_3548 [Bryocella elongata]
MSKRFQLCVEDSRTGNLRVQMHVTLFEGDLLVRQRKAERVEDASGVLIGFKLRTTQGAPAKLRPASLGMLPIVASQQRESCRAISRAEVEANAGLRGVSKTAHLTDEQRVERIRRHWTDVDAIEAAQDKVRSYLGVH